MRRFAAVALTLIAAASAARAAEQLKLTVAGGETTCTSVPVSAPIELINELADAPGERIDVTLVSGKGPEAVRITAQVVKPLKKKDGVLWWIMPEVQAGKRTKWTAVFEVKKKRGGDLFEWEDDPGKQLDLIYAGRPTLRYMYAYDLSSRDRMLATYKPFHHLFDAEGKELITSGGRRGTKYPHHRGLFVGWTIGKHNLWGMAERRQPPGTAQVHRKHQTIAGGPVLAQHAAVIDWNGKEGALARSLVRETRTVTVFRSEAPTILHLQIDITLQSLAGELELRGDAEHAGVHLRAHNDLARGDLKTAEGEWHTRVAKYSFPQGKLSDRVLDYPWAAMNFMLKGKEYTVQIVNSPRNPKGARFSANRPYGRFGVCPYGGTSIKLRPKEPLKLSYRLYVDAGAVPPEKVLSARHAAWADAPKVSTTWVIQYPVSEE